VTVADLRELRTNPRRANAQLLERLAQVLIERGNGMKRVGEILLQNE
jgi:hypothetical protein